MIRTLRGGQSLKKRILAIDTIPDNGSPLSSCAWSAGSASLSRLPVSPRGGPNPRVRTCFVQSAMRCRRRIDRSFVTPFALRRLRRPQPRLTIPARRLPVSFAYADLQARRAIHDSQIAGYRFTHRAARRHRAPLVMRSRHARVPFAPPGWSCAVACCRTIAITACTRARRNSISASQSLPTGLLQYWDSVLMVATPWWMLPATTCWTAY